MSTNEKVSHLLIIMLTTVPLGPTAGALFTPNTILLHIRSLFKNCCFNYLFFCYQHYFFFHTQHHNITSTQNKQNNRHILNILKVQSKGRERGREKVTTKHILPLYNHVCKKKKKKTLPSINNERLGPIDSCRCTFTSHHLQEAMDPICLSTHVRHVPVLYHCPLRSRKPSKQPSLLY